MARHPKTTNPFGWFGLLMIATVSGLIIKVVGDPLVQVFAPRLEDAADEIEDWLDDQDWGERLDDWLKSQQAHEN